MKMIPLAKKSKSEQRKYHAAQRGSWNGLSPATRVAKSKKAYSRSRMKRENRTMSDEQGGKTPCAWNNPYESL